MRLKALNRDKIPIFAANPIGYALTAHKSCRGNINRLGKEDQKKKADAEANETNGAHRAVETSKARPFFNMATRTLPRCLTSL